jgi:hypothetical protein
MRRQYYAINEWVQEAVRRCLRITEADFCHSRMLELTERWQKSFDRDVDFVDKWIQCTHLNDMVCSYVYFAWLWN